MPRRPRVMAVDGTGSSCFVHIRTISYMVRQRVTVAYRPFQVLRPCSSAIFAPQHRPKLNPDSNLIGVSG